ncbi:hypothetical protein E3P99_01508 [Wallemia hederae]|uniref:[Histone H3]-trimethyl-L-lysine(9) demethylase n=1 Tax=Wallemia hederae TaxID=1540922 RepID=A0A4V4LTL0_9BASI|nr:hypothetical protein E3P99_01508 [Wallemia hederae]
MSETQPQTASTATAYTSALPKPSYYYPADDDKDYVAVPPQDNPDDDDYVCRGVPVFEPSMDEFKDFYEYIQKIDRYGMKAGIVKVIPPKEWLQTLPEYKASNLDKIKIKNVIAQHMLGRSGLYKQTNVVKRNVMAVDQWASLAGCHHKAKLQFPTPAPHQSDEAAKEAGRITRGRGSTAQTKSRKKRKITAENSVVEDTKTDDAVSAKDETIDQGVGTPIAATHADSISQSTQPLDPSSNQDPPVSSIPPPQSTSQTPLSDGLSALQNLPPARSGSEVIDNTAKSSTKKKREDQIHEFYDGLNIYDKWLPEGATHDDYNIQGCKYLERLYWRTLGLGDNEVSWYGADLPGSLFDERTTSWNVADLPSYLTEILSESGVGAKLPGVNTPYLYFGTWRATFAWHVEDMDLYSINYIHFGAPKYWYTIPQKQKRKFEQLMAGLFPGESKACPEWLRHKSYLASPNVLASHNIKPSVLVQKQNEFVITFPHGYHSGFNMGFNCAESVNFATEGWTKYGRKAQACTCVKDSVKIDVDQLLDRIEYRKMELEAEKSGQVMKMSIDDYLETRRIEKAGLPQIQHIKIFDYLMPTVPPPHDQQIAWMKWAATQPTEVQHVVIQVPWMQECVKMTLKTTNEKKKQAQIQAQKETQKETEALAEAEMRKEAEKKDVEKKEAAEREEPVQQQQPQQEQQQQQQQQQLQPQQQYQQSQQQLQAQQVQHTGLAHHQIHPEQQLHQQQRPQQLQYQNQSLRLPQHPLPQLFPQTLSQSPPQPLPQSLPQLQQSQLLYSHSIPNIQPQYNMQSMMPPYSAFPASYQPFAGMYGQGQGQGQGQQPPQHTPQAYPLHQPFQQPVAQYSAATPASLRPFAHTNNAPQHGQQPQPHLAHPSNAANPYGAL